VYTHLLEKSKLYTINNQNMWDLHGNTSKLGVHKPIDFLKNVRLDVLSEIF
jgi:hypothetical protein